jgi:hypothetical protein
MYGLLWELYDRPLAPIAQRWAELYSGDGLQRRNERFATRFLRCPGCLKISIVIKSAHELGTGSKEEGRWWTLSFLGGSVKFRANRVKTVFSSIHNPPFLLATRGGDGFTSNPKKR